MTPRAAITKHLLEGDDSVFKAFDVDELKGSPTSNGPAVKPVSAPSPTPAVEPSTPGPTKFDPDAT